MEKDDNTSSGEVYACLSMDDLISGGDSSYSWEELQKIEKRRRTILKRVDNPFWRILGFWDGTCLKVMVKDALMWATLGLYVAVRICSHTGHPPSYLMDLGSSNIDIIGGFLSFFLVLFVNQSNARFNSMFHQSMSCTACIEDVAGVVAAYFPKANAHRIVRYLNAAHAAAYVGLSPATYTEKNFFKELNNTHSLLTDREMSRMSEIGLENGGGCYRELLMWCIREVQIMQDEKVIDARMSGEIRSSIQKFRSTFASLYHDKDQPCHFFYIHFLSLLTAFYLPLFAIATAYGVGMDEGGDIHWVPECLSGLIVFLQAVFVIGLRLLGQVMVDPYGDDVEVSWISARCLCISGMNLTPSFFQISLGPECLALHSRYVDSQQPTSRRPMARGTRRANGR